MNRSLLLALPLLALGQLTAPEPAESDETAQHFERLLPALAAGSGGDRFQSALSEDFAGTISGQPVNREGFEKHFRGLLEAYELNPRLSFRCVAIEPGDTTAATILYEVGGRLRTGGLRQNHGTWRTTWRRAPAGNWQLASIVQSKAVQAESTEPFFADVTENALGATEAFRRQLADGAAHWAATLDAASGIDFYALNGIAIGDYDDDGWEDFYVCQPGGLPNRLFRNRGDGTFDDVTDEAGLGVLDSTSSAVWADFRNRGRQDLLVVTTAGLLLFENDGSGRFRRSPARFPVSPAGRGTMMMAALADYDRDGFLDIVVCQYHAAETGAMTNLLDQPLPYYDANNGAANHLFRNHGDGTFSNVTEAAGLNVNNRRWSFAAAWGDYNADGFPDLYVANDFGRNNLYRNNGDGTFSDFAAEAGVEDIGAGMSVAWADYDGDGLLDLYVSNIWSAAGQRLMSRPGFRPDADAAARRAMQSFAHGNSLYRNRGDGTFAELAAQAGVDNGGWAWASHFLDIGNDGRVDLLVVGGHVTGPRETDLEEYHWRDLLGSSPTRAVRSGPYEAAWREFQKRMTEFGWSTHGGERNRVFANSGGGAMTDVSALSGLDFADDGRAFGIVDFNNDGKLDVILKNRGGPQIRVMHNRSGGGNRFLTLSLTGTRSNRDAIGAKVYATCGAKTQTKEVQAGSGFLSQHSRRVHFGLGACDGPVDVRIDWPGGLSQKLDPVPVNRLLRVTEGGPAEVFLPKPPSVSPPPASRGAEPQPTGTWFIDPVPVPLDSTFRDLHGKPFVLHAPHGTASKTLRATAIRGRGLDWRDLEVPPETLRLAVIVVRRLFVVPPDVTRPFSLLFDKEARLAKLSWGQPGEAAILADATHIANAAGTREDLALPFPGQRYGNTGSRMETFFRIALDCLEAGLHAPALEYFERAAAIDPRSGAIVSGIGTVHVWEGRLEAAAKSFERAAVLDPGSAPVRLNLGATLARMGKFQDAAVHLKQAATMDPASPEVWANLGNVYLDLGDLPNARASLERALALDPRSAMLRNSLGTMYAELGQLDRAEVHLLEAVRLDPGYVQAYLNLGLLYFHIDDRARAHEMLQQCLQLNPANADALRLMERLR